ncbi:MAG TPA: TIGR03013 family XrtA/PEP-CTERM system glycosyltransferase [Acetobacteraceae bacterium]|nr:TIGR03013 family XrtA/PEP-CTERM system glycosyltransferase [Acetobacteraceae bacterium]
MNRLRLLQATMARSLFLIDVTLVALFWPVAWWLGRNEAVTADIRGLFYPLSDLALLYAMGLYRREAFVAKHHSAAHVPMVVGMGVITSLLLQGLVSWLAPSIVSSHVWRDDAMVAGLAFLCFTLCALVARAVLAILLRRRLLRRQLLVVGAGMRAWDLLQMLGKEGASLTYDMAFLHDPVLGSVDPRLAADPEGNVLYTERLHVLEAARQVSADQIVIAPDDRRGMDLEQLLACKKAGFPVVQYLGFVEHELRRVDIKRMDLGWLVFSDGFYFGAIDRYLKRAFDLAVSVTMLIATAPLVLLGMLAIRLEASGPMFFRQERVTLDGHVFQILKLRTMRVDAESDGAVWAARGDNRITRTGAILRRTRIDELPQLINILKGEMSFVGPRPERPMFVEELAAQIPLYRERHMVKAGLTGWAQVNYPYGASVDDARSKLSYDLYYVKNFSILFDFVILLQTLRVVLWPGGAR